MNYMYMGELKIWYKHWMLLGDKSKSEHKVCNILTVLLDYGVIFPDTAKADWMDIVEIGDLLL